MLSRTRLRRAVCFCPAISPLRALVAAFAIVTAAQPLMAQDDAPPPASVRVGTVEVRKVQNLYRVIGRLREARRSTVAAEQAGRVQKMHVIEGTVVKEGDVIIEIDGKIARLELARSEAALAQAEAELAEAKSMVDEQEARVERSRNDLKYLENLFNSGSAKKRELDDARATAKEDASALNSVKAQLSAREATRDARIADVQLAQESVARLIVRAPFDGYVVQKLTEQGQWVTVGGSVVHLYSRGWITGLIDVPARLVNYLEPDAPIEVTIDPLGDERVTGSVKAVIPDGSNAARTFPVTIKLKDQDGRLKPGMSLKAWVPLGTESDRITVPRDAVVPSPNGHSIWVNMEGKAVPVGVSIAFGLGERYVVDVKPGGAPLLDGMQVVIEGAERIFFPGMPLNATTSELPRTDAKQQSQPEVRPAPESEATADAN